MIHEKTMKSLIEKFEKDPSLKRRIVFWYDKEQTVAKDLEELEKTLEEHDVKLKVIQDNYFEIKKLLHRDDTESDYLLYSSNPEPVYNKNWLLDIQLYSTVFSTSKVSEIKSEFEITGYDLDKFLEKHKNFFKNKERVASLKKYYQKEWKEKEFIIGFLAVFSKANTTDIKEILRIILNESLDHGKNDIYQEIIKYDLEEDFWDQMHIHFGYHADHPSLEKLALSFILTHINSKTKISFLPDDREYLNDLKNESEIFLQNWMDLSDTGSGFYQYAKDFSERVLSNEIPHTIIVEQIEHLNTDEFIEADSLPLIDKNVILRIIQQLKDDSEKYADYLSWIQKRKTKHWFSEFEHLYLALEYAVNIFDFAHSHEKIERRTLQDLFTMYQKTWYAVDTFYRKFYFHCNQIPEKDVWKKIQPEIENLYNNNILDNLLTHWSNAVNKELDNNWDTSGIPLQHRFFEQYIQPIINKDEKIAVIISDALRFEIAQELIDILNLNTKGTIQLDAMLGVLPSYTKLGMASLLPYQSIHYKQDEVFVDDLSTSGLENRGKILSNEVSDSLVLRFNELLRMNRDEARDLTKGKNVIYIYQDSIDAIGDDQKTEHDVFTIVEKTLQDILKMIKKLSLSLNITHVMVTSDHGFIYKRDVLKEREKLDISPFSKQHIIEKRKRFILSTEQKSIENVHMFKMNYLSPTLNDLYVYAPYGDLRFKQQGGGSNFVHGGLSPQEIMIPALYYKHVRDEKTLDKKGIKHGKVNLTVLNPSRKITNNTFHVKLYQTEKVTDKLQPITCKVALWDLDASPPKKVSEEKTIIADRTSDNVEDRQIPLVLTLGLNIKNKTYYLRVLDDDPKAIKKEILKIPFDVDLAISRDFGD